MQIYEAYSYSYDYKASWEDLLGLFCYLIGSFLFLSRTDFLATVTQLKLRTYNEFFFFFFHTKCLEIMLHFNENIRA